MLVLQALKGSTVLLKVFRDTSSGGGAKLVCEDVSSGSFPDVPSASVLSQIDRLIFFDQPETEDADHPEIPVLDMPFIPGTVKFKLSGSTNSKRRFELEYSLVRCFLKNHVPPVSVLPKRSEAAAFTLVLECRNPDSNSYTPLDIAKSKAQWHQASSSSNPHAVPLKRAELIRLFEFEFSFLSWDFELGEVFGVGQAGAQGKWFARAFSIAPEKALQIEFAVQTSETELYQLDRGMLPKLQLSAQSLHWRQRPKVAVEDWKLRPGNQGLVPEWRIEMSLPVRKNGTAKLSGAILDYYNKQIATPVHHSLRKVREGQPLSLLPLLTVERANPSDMKPEEWLLDLVVTGEWEKQLPKAGKEDVKELQFPDDFEGKGDFSIRYGKLRPGSLPKLDAGGEILLPTADQGLLVSAKFPCFGTVKADKNGNPSALILPYVVHGLEQAAEEFGPQLQVEMALNAAANAAPQENDADPLNQRVRLGALEFAFGRAEPKTPLEIVLPALDAKVVFALRFSLREDRIAGMSPRVSPLDLYLPVLRVGPGGQDALPGEEFAELFQSDPFEKGEAEYEARFMREQPLVLELSAAAGMVSVPAKPPYCLVVAETVLERESQTVDLRLAQFDITAGPAAPGEAQALWIVDRDPLLMAVVQFEDFLEQLISGTSNEIANFSTRSGSAWEISAGAQGFDLVLPPQGVGEAMEKNQAALEGRPPDIEEDKIIDYRFTPPTVLRVLPSYFKQRFAEPPWNLRRLLGFPGQRDPGMGVEQIDFELFYGLAGRVVSKDLRVAEIAARLGNLPGRQPHSPLWPASQVQQDEYIRHRRLWAQWYALLLGRLAILEPWTHRQEDRDLVLTDEVSYRLRQSARLKFPTPIPLKPGTADPDLDRLKILAPDVPASTYDPSLLAPEAPGAPLPGGVAWPFESINLYNLLWTNPQAESGELHRPYFSALGGWGFQKAVFADGQLRIYADTAMGRTHSVTLEIFGRISVGWHLAKLVIVYERSVLPTRQFVHEADPSANPTVEAGEQDRLRGRPVLRKVREYVEILEPLRKFPDNASSALENGCVLGIEFPEGARKINVTSRWGEDVGVAKSPPDQAEGWKVPLWLRGARPEDVYPKPQILAILAAAQTDGPVTIEIDEPEKLYFFTNTKEKRARDPHEWPAVQGVDFGFAHETAWKPPTKPEAWTIGQVEGPVAEKETAVKGGLGPFTFALKQASHAIDVMNARSGQATGALLRNVTLMRGYVHRVISPTQNTFLETRDQVNAGLADAQEWLGKTRTILRNQGVNGQGTPTGAAGTLLQQVKTMAENLRERLTGANHPEIPDFEKLCPKLRKQVLQVLAPVRVVGKAAGENFAREALERVNQVFDAGGDIADARTALENAGKAASQRWTAEITRLNPIFAEADRAKNQLLGEADDVAREAIGFLEDYDDAVASLPVAWAAAAVVWESALEPWRQARVLVRSALTGVDDAVLQAARPWVAALPNAFRFTLQPLAEEVEKVLKTVETLSGLALMEAAFENGSQQDYQQAAVQLRADIRAVIAELEGKWTTLFNGCATELGTILTRATDLKNQLATEAETVWTTMLGQLDGALGAAANLDAARDALRGQIDAMLQGWEGVLDSIDSKVGDSLDGHCETFFGTAAAYLAHLQRLLGDDRLKRWLDHSLGHLPTGEELQGRLQALERELADAVRGFMDRVSGALSEELNDLTKPLIAAGDSVMRLVRAFGEAPRVPSLDFRLPDFSTGELGDRLAHIGYYFQDLAGKIPLPHVDITPVLAKANDLGKDLINALEIKLPTTQLLDRFKPTDLPNFDLKNIFPNFAGLKLENLFEGLKLPSGANDNVKITHGEDPQSLTGWVEIQVNQKFENEATLFSFAGLVMQVRGGRFEATSRIEGGANQGPRQSFQGQILGNWAVTVGSFELVVLERTALRFDDAGRITFDVSPDKVKLPGPMAFLADLISKFNFGSKGFTFKVVPEGIQLALNLPLPDVQGGAFGMSNLSLGFFFELSVLPSFVITTGARVATAEAPFTLTIFILGGAGWFDFRLRYSPGDGSLVATVSIGIMASASLAISLGPVSGGVYAYFGIVVDYTARQGAEGQLAVAIVLRFCGRVSLLGIVTAYLEVGLEAQYTNGGGLTGRGYVSVEIKICWCFTLSIQCSVSYTFGGSGGGGSTRTLGAGETEVSHDDAAGEYCEMFA